MAKVISTLTQITIVDREAGANIVAVNTDLTTQMGRTIATLNAIQVCLAVLEVRQPNGTGQSK